MSGRPPAPAAPAPAAPKSPSPKRSPRATIPDAVPLEITSGIITGSDRIVIYGTGGIGKTTLAQWLPSPLFLDLELSTKKSDANRDIIAEWMELRGKLATIAGGGAPPGLRSIVIDTATVAEMLATEYVIETRTTDKGKRVDSVEGYGWGKGWQYVYDEMLALLADLDRVAELGFNVCLVAHDVATIAPNPGGEDFLRWEPCLYGGDRRGRANIRALVKNWAEHLVFIGYDIAVEDGKGKGHGTRTIYTQELATHIAKSRTKELSIDFTLHDAGALWRELSIS